MNCQQVHNLIEDVIDGHLAGAVKRQVDQHLNRCDACRRTVEAERREHVRWSGALHESVEGGEALPPDFMARFVSSVCDEPSRRTVMARIPRWARIAACLAIVASFAAFGAWTVASVSGNSRASALADDSELVRGSSVPNALDLMRSRPAGEATSSVSAESFIVITQGEHPMKKYLALTASAMGAATVSGVALLTSSPSCIISGSTERFCSSVAWAAETDLDSRVTTADYGAPSESFDTRLQVYGYGDAMDFFRSDAPGLAILIH